MRSSQNHMTKSSSTPHVMALGWGALGELGLDLEIMRVEPSWTGLVPL